MSPRCSFLLLVVLAFMDGAVTSPQRSTAGEKVLEIPSSGSVKTLQQVLLEGEEDEEDDAVEVAVAAQSLDRIKSEDLVAPDTAQRILPPQAETRAAAYSKVTSASPARLTLSPAAKLHGGPGETVQIEFFLTNLSPRNYFTALARESSAPPVSPDAVNFPQAQTNFLVGLSELKPNVGENETRPIVLTMKVPYDAYPGMRRLVTLEVQPYGNNVAGNANMMTRRLYFTVGSEEPRAQDSEAPACRVTSDNFQEHCGEYQAVGACEQRRWTANFDLSDIGSGLRSIVERPLAPYNDPDIFYSHDNFIIGDRTTASFVYAGSCCPGGGAGITLTVFDVAGNEGVCRAGGEDNYVDDNVIQAAGLSSTATIIISVVVVALLLLLAGAGVAIFVIRRRRKAELAEMRESPQAR